MWTTQTLEREEAWLIGLRRPRVTFCPPPQIELVMMSGDSSTTGGHFAHGLQAKRCFRAMNTEVEVTLSDWRYAHRLPAIEALFHGFEARFSRFLPNSELSRFNARTTPRFTASDQLAELLAECAAYFEITDGLFTPLVIDALEGAGYDVSFDQIRSAPALRPVTVASFDSIVFPAPTEVELPLGLRIDLGGIGKGYCVDLAAECLEDCTDLLINAGGDIYGAGLAPDGTPWRIAVADPRSPGDLVATLQVSDRGVATSWTTKRVWRAGDAWVNHIIDPRTGMPVDSRVAGVTVVATTTTDADVFAKTALILGPEEGLDFLESQDAAGLLVLVDGTLVATSGWSQYLTAESRNHGGS
jgi:thiamine biosynthesis lipoprotein